MMNNCRSHVTRETFELPGENHVGIVTSALHITKIFQALDVSLFGTLKIKEKFWVDKMTIGLFPR
jgi:hypothetical protein